MAPSSQAILKCPRPKTAILAGGLLCVALVLTAVRVVYQYQTPGPFDPSAQGFCDFHNGIYFPSRALIDGVSPYSQAYADSNPVARQIPFFSPVILVLHAPLTLLPLHVAEIAFFVISVFVILAMAWLAVAAAGCRGRVDWVLVVAAWIAWSRCGHITLFDGYFTFEMVLCSWLAVHWGASRPWSSALALVVVSAKPMYILPLGFLMLARGHLRALLIGAALSILAAILPLIWLAGHYAISDSDTMDWSTGFQALLTDIETTQQVHMSMDDEMPIHSWTRIDLLAIVSKWFGIGPSQAVHLVVMMLMLVVPMWLVRKGRTMERDDGTAGLTGGLIFSCMLTSIYHQSYDALLVVAPCVGLATGKLSGWKAVGLRVRWLIAACLVLPMFNYLSTRTLLEGLAVPERWRVTLTSLSGLSLFAGHLLICISFWQLIRHKRASDLSAGTQTRPKSGDG